MRTSLWARGLIVIVTITMVSALAACQSPPSETAPDKASSASIAHGDLTLNRTEWRTLPPVREVIADHENSARVARDLAAAEFQPLPTSAASLSLSLYRVLFAEAYELAYERGLWSPSMGLVPPHEGPALARPREFYLVVLAGLVQQSPALAWIDEQSENPVHPDTGEPGPRLRVNLMGFDSWKGLARAEISVIDLRGGETGRTVDATWNGWEWQLRHQPVTWTR